MAEGSSPLLQFPQTTVECEKCGADVDVTWFCKNCPASLCKTCKEDHSKDKLLKKHEVVQRSGSVLWSHGSWKVRKQCKKHKNSYLETYCNDCKVPCCIDCMLENHKRHDLSKLNTKYFEAESRLNSFVDDLSKSSIQTIQNEISVLKEKIKTSIENFDNVKSELNAAEIKLQKVVSEHFANLRKDLVLKQNKITSDIEEKIKSGENQLREIENLIAETELKIRTGGLDLIEYFPTRLIITSANSDIATPIPRFEFNESILKECDVHIRRIQCDTSGDSRKGSLVSVLCDKEKISISDIEVEMVSTFNANICRSFAPVYDNTTWVSFDMSNTMYLYDEAGKEVRSLRVHGASGICDMAVQNNGDIIVSCMDQKVRRVSVDGYITTLIDTKPFFPSGVCLTEKEEIVVCMSCQEDKDHVAVFTPDGKSKIREVKRKDNNEKLFFLPYRVVINDGKTIVVNQFMNVVSVNQHSGKFLWVYDGSQSKLSQKFKPMGMCRDEFSNLLVTDANNHCIHYIDNKGSLIKIIMVRDYGLEFPWGICVDSQSGRIWCGSSKSKQVVILKYLK